MINPVSENTYYFFENMLKDMDSYFHDDLFHFGNDETSS